MNTLAIVLIVSTVTIVVQSFLCAIFAHAKRDEMLNRLIAAEMVASITKEYLVTGDDMRVRRRLQEALSFWENGAYMVG